MVPPPQILITSPVLDLENNQVPEITVTREVEGEEEVEVEVEEEEEEETTSQIPIRGVSLEAGSRQDPRTELFIRQRLARLGLAPAPACRCGQLLEALEQQLECPVCLSTNLGQVFQCHRGHTMCARCRGRLWRCPLCRADLFSMPPIRNLALESLSSLL